MKALIIALVLGASLGGCDKTSVTETKASPAEQAEPSAATAPAKPDDSIDDSSGVAPAEAEDTANPAGDDEPMDDEPMDDEPMDDDKEAE